MKKGIFKYACYLLLVICCCLFLPFVSYSGNNEGLMESIRRAVLKELTNSVSDQVELNEIRIVKGADIMKYGGDYAIKGLNMSGYNGRNKALFAVSLTDKNAATREVIVETSYDVMTNAFVASRPLSVGTVLTEGDFYEITQKSAKLPPGAITERKDIEGKILKTNIGQGILFKSGYLSTTATIKRGQKVNLVIEGGNVVISTRGQLRSDAVVGGAARVLCDMSKKEVSGILVAPNTVKVKI